ncbi:MAG: hypothetical protein Q9221_006814 [Calogaya cf. arnoldii]
MNDLEAAVPVTAIKADGSVSWHRFMTFLSKLDFDEATDRTYHLFPLQGREGERERETATLNEKDNRQKQSKTVALAMSTNSKRQSVDSDMLFSLPTIIEFLLSHNAANNAIAQIKIPLALLFDSSIWDDKDFHYAEKDIAKGSDPVLHLMDDLLGDPLDVRPNTVIMSFDGEGHDRFGQYHITEWGVAWLDLEKVNYIRPGKFGINWHRYIEARHFRNRLYPGHCLKRIFVAPLGSGFQYGERRSEDAPEAVLPALVLCCQRKQRVDHTGSSERGHSVDANPIT